MNLLNFERLFNSIILERGQVYYKENRVKIQTINNQSICALVEGSSAYHVLIETNGFDILNMKCDCPFAQKTNKCKHMAALLFYLKDNPIIDNDFFVQENEQISTFLNSLDKTQLIEYLESLIRTDYTFKHRLIDDFAITIDDYQNQLVYIQQIIKANQNIEDDCDKFFNNPDFNINDHPFRQYQLALKKQVIKSNDILIKRSDLVAIVEYNLDVANTLIVPINSRVEDANQEIINLCLQNITKTIEQAKPEQLIAIYKLLQAKFNDQKYKELYSQILSLLFTLNIPNHENELYSLVFAKVENIALNNTFFDELLIDEIMKLYLPILKRNDKMWLNNNLIKTAWKSHYVRTEVIQEYIKLHNYANAISLLNDSINLIKNQGYSKYRENDLLKDYSELRNLYAKTQQLNKYLEITEYVLINYDHDLKDLYYELKALYSNEAWIIKRELIYNQIPSDYKVANLIALEKDPLLLYNYLTKKNNYQLYNIHLKKIKTVKPIQLLEIFKHNIITSAKVDSQKNNFRNTIKYMILAKEIPNSKGMLKEVVIHFKKEYWQRTDFIRNLNKFNFY